MHWSHQYKVGGLTGCVSTVQRDGGESRVWCKTYVDAISDNDEITTVSDSIFERECCSFWIYGDRATAKVNANGLTRTGGGGGEGFEPIVEVDAVDILPWLLELTTSPLLGPS